MNALVARPVRDLVRDADGATAVEYAVMLSLIIAVAYFAISLLGGGVQGRWRHNADSIVDASRAASGG